MLDSQERNLVCVYRSGFRGVAAAEMQEALPCMEPDVRAAAKSAIDVHFHL
jgi:hypothetical protein